MIFDARKPIGITAPAKPAITRAELDRLIDRDTLFRWTYVPFVVYGIMWEYVDTMNDMAFMLKRKDIKRDIRELYALNTSIYYEKRKYIDFKYQKREDEHGMGLESDLKPLFNDIQAAFTEGMPDDSSLEEKWLIGSAYAAFVIHSAISGYTNGMITDILAKFGLRSKNVMPDAFFKMRAPLANICKTVRAECIGKVDEWSKTVLERIREIEIVDE